MDQPQYSTRSASKKLKRSLFIGIGFVVLASITIGTALIISRSSSTDNRSQAGISDTATFNAITKDEGSEVVIELYADTTKLQNPEVRSFDVSLELEASTSAVLGLTSQLRNVDAHNTLTTQLRKLATPTPQKLRVCLDDVKQSGSNLVWTTRCKGDTSKGNCTAQTITLTPEEKVRYEAWVRMRSPTGSKCVLIDPPSSVTISPLANGTAPSVSPTTQPTPSLPPISLVPIIKQDGMTILAPNRGFVQDKPVVSKAPDQSNVTISLKGRVVDSTQAPYLQGRFLVAQIRIPKDQSKRVFNVKITRQSLKGIRSIAPGVEVELLEKVAPTTTESTSSGQSVGQ